MTTTILKANSYFGGTCVIQFTETGCEIISDTRRVKDGYLHICEKSADAITDACRDSIIKYLYSHDVATLPGIGETPQAAYFKGLSRSDTERIGGVDGTVYYNR